VGIIPALRLSRLSPAAVLASGRRGHGAALTRRGGQLVIAAEIALAVVLVAGAGLMIRSFARLLDVDLGFDPDAIVTVEATTVDPNPAAQAQFYRLLLERLRALPEIEAAGAIDHLPFGESGSATSVTVDGASDNLGVSQVLPGYFEAMGLRLRTGRLLSDADYETRSSVALINETASRQLFGGASPIGRQLTVTLRRGTYTIIGVVADIRSAFGRASDHLFLPFDPDQQGRFDRWLTMVVRPRRFSAGLADRLRDVAQQAGPGVLVERIRTGGEWLGDRVTTPRQRTVLLGLLGGLGLVLATVGVFGMTAYAVSRRTQEIGVRMAFGAQPRAMVLHVLRDAVIPIVAGTAIGLGGAALATRLIASFLFQTDPTDPATFAAAALALVTAGSLAALGPARRAAHVDPVIALRGD
jgi:predicted permease